MAEATPVMVPKEGVSDDSYLLQELVKADGQAVQAGEVLVRCESSKATVEINAPCAGFVHYRYRAGQEIPVGGVLALVTATAEAPAGLAAASPPSMPAASAPSGASAAKAPPPKPLNGVRPGAAPAIPSDADGARRKVTPLARNMIRAHALAGDHFEDLEVVRGSDVRARLGESERPPTSTRFSQAAQALARERGVDIAQFPNAGLVTRAHILRMLEGPEASEAVEAAPETRAAAIAPSAPAKAAPAPKSGFEPQAEFEIEPLTKAKRNEIRALSEGQEGALASVLTAMASAEGFFDAATGAASPKLLPIVVYEASRLLEAYPDLNGFFDEASGGFARYREVNVGVAFEIDQGLKVPVLKAPNRSGIDALRASLDDLIGKYLENRLGTQDLTGATFTVTDLSNDGVFTFVPLISRGQCAILGIGGAQALSDVTRAFPLSLAFDHRVSTGRRAARFLADLKARLESYADALSGGQAGPERRCRQCKRAERELRDRQYLLMASRAGRVDYLCTTCAKGF